MGLVSNHGFLLQRALSVQIGLTLCTVFSLPWACGVWVAGTAAVATAGETGRFSLLM